MKEEHCPIPNNNPYKKIIEAERKDTRKLDTTKVKYYIAPELINKLGFENTTWGFSWRNKITTTICYSITQIHHPAKNEFTYSISKLDSKKEVYDKPLFEGHILSFEHLVQQLDALKVPRKELKEVLYKLDNKKVNGNLN